MLYGRPYDQSSPDATTCQCCGQEWRCPQEHAHICQHKGCEKPISACCIEGGHAKRCEDCLEWHCAEHLTKTDCGLLCRVCLVDLMGEGRVSWISTHQVLTAEQYWDRLGAEQARAIGAAYRARVGSAA